MAIIKNKELSDAVIDQIEALREQRKISKYNIARKLDASWNTLHYVFSRKTDPTLGTLTAILDAMGLKIKIVDKNEK